jgi:hypothetical protein
MLSKEIGSLHKQEIEKNWNLARENQKLLNIEPLD